MPDTADTAKITTYAYGVPHASFFVSMDMPRAVGMITTIGLALASMMLGSMIAAGLVAIAGALLVFLRPAGLPVVSWFGPFLSYLGRPRSDRDPHPLGAAAPDFGDGDASPSAETPRRSPRKRKNRARWPAPLGILDLTTETVGGHEAAVCWSGSKRRPLASVAWLSELPQPFGLLDFSEQDRLLAGWGRVLAGTAAQGSAVTKVSVIQRQVSDLSTEATSWIEAHPSDVEHSMRADYMAMIEQIGAAAARSEVLVGLTCALSERRNTDDLLLEAEQFQRRMETAKFTMEPLSYGRFGAYISAVLNGTALLGAEDADPEETGPLAWEEAWQSLRLDGRLHHHYVVSPWPRIEVAASYLEPLLTTPIPNAVRTVAIHWEPVATDVAMRRARSGVAVAELNLNHKHDKGAVIGSADKRVHEQAQRRDALLTAGHAEHLLSAFCSVSVAEDHDAERARRSLVYAATTSHLGLRPAYGTQAQAFAAMLPLGMVRYPARLLG